MKGMADPQRISSLIPRHKESSESASLCVHLAAISYKYGPENRARTWNRRHGDTFHWKVERLWRAPMRQKGTKGPSGKETFPEVRREELAEDFREGAIKFDTHVFSL